MKIIQYLKSPDYDNRKDSPYDFILAILKKNHSKYELSLNENFEELTDLLFDAFYHNRRLKEFEGVTAEEIYSYLKKL